MIGRLLLFAAMLFGLSLAGKEASAHPHVFVTMKSEVLFNAAGAVTGIRHAWTFDDMYSSFATQGLESKEKGAFTRQELAPLAEVNVTSLKEYDFFTYAKANGGKAEFKDPVDYWLEYHDSLLTLHFTLPLKAPVKANAFDLEVYDPTYFVDFALAEKDPVALAAAPAACKMQVARPQQMSMAQGKRLSESFFNQLDAASGWGAQFASKISVRCP